MDRAVDPSLAGGYALGRQIRKRKYARFAVPETSRIRFRAVSRDDCQLGQGPAIRNGAI
jgi:hypothetical protein